MAPKKDLKSYVRFDGTGRIVPGSNILGRTKPKVGKWAEGPAYVCCSGSSIYVCGAGTEDVNGRYYHAGIRNGKPYYRKGNYVLSWGEWPSDDPNYQDWEIYDSTNPGVWYYYSTDDVSTPDLIVNWTTDDGEDPTPTVQLTACTTSTTTTECLAIYPILLAGGFELAEGACASYGGDMNNSYIDTEDFATATILYNFQDCSSPGNGFYSNGVIVRECVDGVLGVAANCSTTTTTTTVG